MSENYGKNTKKIVFSDTDHNHARLILRLRHDGITQARFFRSIVSGYIEGDERIQNYITEISQQAILKKTASAKLQESGRQKAKGLGLSDQQVENLFDLIAEEYPEL